MIIILHEDYTAVLKEYDESMKRIAKAFRDPFIQINEFQNSVKFVLPSIDLPKIEFPQIVFPSIKIDWQKIKSLTEYNSLNGWTLTGEMDIKFYLNEDLLQLDQNQLDSLFLSYYESNENKNYQITKTTILDEIENKWEHVLKDCFELYEQDKSKVIVPMLISIIEGEISNIVESAKIGRKLFNEWEGQIKTEKEELTLIVLHSLYQYLSTDLFGSKDFAAERGSMLNRNWVLHGRDNPKYWSKVDVLKLINVLSSLQFVKGQ